VSLRIEYHEHVDTDLEHAWTWYEGQERGLGDRFLDAIHATVVRASRWPNSGSPILRDDDDEIIERTLRRAMQPSVGRHGRERGRRRSCPQFQSYVTETAYTNERGPD
jgi:hypothetical protein